MKKSTLILAFAAAAMSAGAFAGEVYGGAGTTGVVAGYSMSINDHLGARAEVNHLNYGRDFDTSDVKYDAKVKMQSLGVYADYFPFVSSGLRLTAGAMIGNDKVTGHAKGENGTVTINGQQYNAAGESLDVSAKFPTVRPYVGIGYGHTARKGLGFIADVGVAYGKASVSLTASQGLANAAGQSNIDAERQKAQDKLDKYDLYPVIKVGVGYTW